MLRTLLIATALLTASGASFAHGGDYGYGRVVAVEPHFVISFGTRQPDGFRVLYESGGDRYWTHRSYYPGPAIMLPPPYRVERVYYRDYGRDWDDRGWNHRRGERDGWRDGGWEHRRVRHHYDDD
ncbi:MAG: hypothetical protein ACM3KD_01235 [Hyphomicrobiaceae bacterium]